MPSHCALRPAVAVAFAVLAAPLFLACSTGHTPPRSESRVVGSDANVRLVTEAAVSARAFRAAPEVVWRGLMEVYGEMEIPVTEVRDAERRLETADVAVTRIGRDRMAAFLDCGSGLSGPRVNTHEISLTVVSHVLPAGDSTVVRIELDAWARPRTTTGNPIHCRSRNRLEARILGNLTLWLAARRESTGTASAA